VCVVYRIRVSKMVLLLLFIVIITHMYVCVYICLAMGHLCLRVSPMFILCRFGLEFILSMYMCVCVCVCVCVCGC